MLNQAPNQRTASRAKKSAGMATGGAALSSDGAGTANDVAAWSGPAPHPSSAGAVSASAAREADAACGTKGAAPAPASSDDEIVTPAETIVSITGFASRVGFARGARSQAALAVDDPAASFEETPDPRYAGLVSDFLLLDRAAMERAIDRFLDQFESIAAELAHFDPSLTLLTTASAAALASLASGVIIQRRRSQADGANAPAEDREEELTHFSGLPNSWNWGLAGT